MKIQVLQENFSKALSFASRFTSIKAQLPILSNIKLQAQKNTLKLYATNLEMGVALSIGAKVDKEGEIALPAKTLSDVVSSLGSTQINLSADKENLSISTDAFNSTLAGVNTSDFPQVPEKLDGKPTELALDDFKKALNKTLFCVSIDESRPILTGVYLEFTSKGVVVVATDGFRLSIRTLNLKTADFGNIVVPRNILFEILKLEEASVAFSVSTKASQISFQTPQALISSRIMQGEYPNYKKIIPVASDTKIALDRQDFLAAVKLASVFARDAGNVIKLLVDKGGVRLTSESGRVGKQETKVEAKTEGQSIEIAFNYKFLTDVLQVIESDDLTIELAGQNSPAKFIDSSDPSFLHLVMPVKI